MIEFSVKHDIDAAIRQVEDRFARQIPFATAKALTMTAMIAKQDLYVEMMRVFDRPKPYTLNSLYVKPATKSSLTALVKLKDATSKGMTASQYLTPQIAGGDRQFKRFERALYLGGYLPPGHYAVPGRAARFDAYGNVSSGQITQILSYLKTNPDQQQNRTARSSKRAPKRGGYFVGRPGNYKPLGVWQRTASGNVLPILIFVPFVLYQKVFDFSGVVKRAIERNMMREFRSAISLAIRTAR